ncbi:hypothetical protein GCM10009854_36120 [Saccharopolyspora halophila]|uniref:YbaB/EbfC family DNA-binding protein n=1 Tax=Saccharopolyspora halophila TaxID=405551 RepID=A0ABN3GLF5_9PSEU
MQVTVDSNGTLRNLELSESAGNRPMSQLAAEIMRIAQAARAKVPDLMQDAIADTVGVEDTAAQHILSEARRTFPQPEDEQPEQQSAPERGDFEDDDFSGGSFLR